MQAERVQITSKQLLAKGCASSWFVPLEVDASVDDILKIFAQFLISLVLFYISYEKHSLTKTREF